jgi:hypothetical protein
LSVIGWTPWEVWLSAAGEGVIGVLKELVQAGR